MTQISQKPWSNDQDHLLNCPDDVNFMIELNKGNVTCEQICFG